MKCKKTWFYNFGVIVAVILILSAFATCFSKMTEGAANPAGMRGVLLVVLIVGVALVRLLAWVYVRFQLDKYFSADETWIFVLEIIAVVVIVAIGIWMRVDLIRGTEYTLNEQEIRYLEITNHIKEQTLRTESVEYCEYLAQNPHDIGYAVMLNMVLPDGYTEVVNGLYLNVFLAAGSFLLLFLIARKMSGRVAGLLVLVWTALLPFEVQKVLSLTEQPATEFFLIVCSALFIHTLLDFDKVEGRPGVCFAWNIILGVLLAIGAVLNPVLIFLGIAMLIVVVPQKMGLPNKPKNDLPLLLRAIHHGWIRGLLILLPFMLLYGILFSNIEMAINRDVSAFGSFVKTIREACALIKMDFVGSFSVAVEKFEQIWCVSGIQGMATAAMLVIAMIGLVSMHQREGSFQQLFVLFLGSVAVFGSVCISMPLIENSVTAREFLMAKNPCTYLGFCCLLLAGHGVQSFFEDAEENLKRKADEEDVLARQKAARRRELEAYKKVEEEVTKIREEALANVFDMNYALEHGHVIMTVSEAYGNQKKEENAEKADAEGES